MKMEIKVVNDEIKVKKQQIVSLERQIAHSMSDSQGKLYNLKLPPVMLICTQFGFQLFCSLNYVNISDCCTGFAVLHGDT